MIYVNTGLDRCHVVSRHEAIEGMGSAYGDPGGCVVCHRGNPAASEAQDGQKDEDAPTLAVGTAAYKEYMTASLPLLCEINPPRADPSCSI